MRHGLPYAANCSILFTERPLLQRAAAAKAAGLDAVEFWWPFADATPDDAEVEAFVRSIQDAGVALIGLNFAAGDMPGGDRGLVSWPGRESEFRASVDIAVGIGRELGTRAFNALYGNRDPDASAEAQDELATENLAYAGKAVAALDGVVLVEPVSGAPRYPLHTAAEVVAVLDRVRQAFGVANLRLLADLYHLSVNGDDVGEAITRYADRIGHVQVADAPGRHEPGTGTLDLDGYLAAIAASGYRGWAALEYVPSTTTEDGLGFLASG
jgi:hydroxypyruvate isomerase